jgi:hypothetical protein
MFKIDRINLCGIFFINSFIRFPYCFFRSLYTFSLMFFSAIYPFLSFFIRRFVFPKKRQIENDKMPKNFEKNEIKEKNQKKEDIVNINEFSNNEEVINDGCLTDTFSLCPRDIFKRIKSESTEHKTRSIYSTRRSFFRLKENPRKREENNN